jgi:hypothetical protein
VKPSCGIIAVGLLSLLLLSVCVVDCCFGVGVCACVDTVGDCGSNISGAGLPLGPDTCNL